MISGISTPNRVNCQRADQVFLLLCLQVVWTGKGLQCSSHGPARTQSGRPLQLLLPALHHEDRPHVGRSGTMLYLFSYSFT